MDRFYQNLLGQREGLEQPLPKARHSARPSSGCETSRWTKRPGSRPTWRGA
jgi:hypothetical protein